MEIEPTVAILPELTKPWWKNRVVAYTAIVAGVVVGIGIATLAVNGAEEIIDETTN